MVEVDGVEDLVGNAKIERSGDTVPQLIKTGNPLRTARITVILYYSRGKFTDKTRNVKNY